MKRIFILAFICFLLTGCFDYQELNNRAVIAGIAIDYEEETFHIDLEILNNKKSTGGEEPEDKTYYISGEGKTLDEAFQNCHIKISKDPYYAHVKILILGEETAREKLTEVIDYMIRDPAIRNIFIPVVAKGSSAREILESTTTENPVVSTSIQSMIENNKTNDSVSIVKDFEVFANEIIDPLQDGYMNTVSKENDTLLLSGIAVFKEENLTFFLDVDESIVFNTLNNDSTNFYVQLPCQDDEQKYLTINLYQNKNTNIEFEDEGIIIKSKLDATIIEDSCHYDFRFSEIYTKLEKEFEPIIKEKFAEVIKLLKQNQTDILGINNQYYKKYQTYLNNWYDKQFLYEITVNINKNGLIFEVTQND